MDHQQILGAIAATLEQNPEIRENAEKQLKEAEKITGFVTCLLECLKNSEVPDAVKQSCSVFLKRNVDKFYDNGQDDSKYQIHENDKQFLRSNILQVLVVVPDNIRNQLIVIIKKMIKCDYEYDNWTDDLNSQILSFLTNTENNPHMFLAGCLTLLQLTKCFEYAKEDKKSNYMKAMTEFLPVMQKLCEQFINSTDANAVLLLKILLKSFFALAQYNLPIDLFTAENANSWIQILVQVLEQDIPNEDSNEYKEMDEADKCELSFWKAKKWALHIANRLFERYGSPGNVEDQYENFAKFFMGHAAVPLLESQLKLLAKKSAGQWVSPRVIQLSLSYIEQCVTHSQTWIKIKGEIFVTLLKKICFPLMCFSEEDAELWEDDPEEYIRSKFDVFEELTSPKSAAESFICTACTKRKDILGIVMEYIQELLGNMANETPEKIDGIFNLICTVSEQLMKKKPYKSQLDYLTNQFFIGRGFEKMPEK